MSYIKNFLHPTDGKLKEFCSCFAEDHFPSENFSSISREVLVLTKLQKK